MVSENKHERYLELMKLCEQAEVLRDYIAAHATTVRRNNDALARYKRTVTPGVVLELLRDIDTLSAVLINYEKVIGKIAGIGVEEVGDFVYITLTEKITL